MKHKLVKSVFLSFAISIVLSPLAFISQIIELINLEVNIGYWFYLPRTIDSVCLIDQAAPNTSQTGLGSIPINSCPSYVK